MPAKHHRPNTAATAPSPRSPDKSGPGKTLGLLVMYGYTLGGIVLPIILLLPRTMFHDGPSPLWAVPYFILWSVPLHLLKRLDPKGSPFR